MRHSLWANLRMLQEERRHADADAAKKAAEKQRMKQVLALRNQTTAARLHCIRFALR